MRLILGVAVALVLGLSVGPLLSALRRRLRVDKQQPATEVSRLPAWLTGAIERIFFTVMVAYDISGTGTAMMAWLALKFATNWNYPGYPGSTEAGTRTLAFSALLAGLVSMLCALIGGLIARGTAAR